MHQKEKRKTINPRDWIGSDGERATQSAANADSSSTVEVVEIGKRRIRSLFPPFLRPSTSHSHEHLAGTSIGRAMGCAASKLDNEDTVRRCKERRGLMKQAVHSRHHLASAHADYLRSLRQTGAALSRFAADEPLTVSDDTPPVLLRSMSTASSYVPAPSPAPTPPPPPSQPVFTPPSPTIASSKLPHILSESSPPPTPPQKYPSHKYPSHKYPPFPSNASTYSTTPSQSSSVWNWENFYPPSPPGSDFYRNKAHGERTYNEDGEDEEEETVTEQEEVRCSEWFEHDGSHSSSSSLSDEENDKSRKESPARSEATPSVATRSNYAASSSGVEWAPSMRNAEEKAAKGRSEAGSTVDGEISNMRMVVRHRNLAEIVKAIEEYFEKAAVAGGPVSDLLETGRAQFDRSFRQLKKTVYHSNSVLSNLSSSWTSKPPLAIRYQLDAGKIENSGGGKSHASTLERLLAWEKKLYEEVKARQGVMIAHQKKLSALQSQEYRGHDEEKLDKTKASIKKLQSLILVTSQAVSTTSSAIVNLRDNELASQLVELCNGFTHMWRLMNQFHEVQNHIVQQVRGLVNRSLASDSTSEPHRQATRDLEAAVSAWHSSFSRLISYQREYVRSLHGWLRLTVHPVSDEQDQPVATNISSELFTFCDEWKQALDRLPDTVASEAIKSFITVVHSITMKQSEELKIKKRADKASKELEKKSSALRNIERKFYQSYSMVGIGLPDSGADTGQVFDARDPLAEKKAEIAACRSKVEDEMLRHKKAIEATRAMTLNNIQTGLPGVFQAMTGFSGVFAESLEGVCTRAGALR